MSAKGSGTEMNEEQEDVLKEAFNFFDRDGNGWICVEELGKAARAAGRNPSDKDVAQMLKKYDQNESNKIEFDEFKQFMSEVKAKDNGEDAIRDAFKVFDRDGSGYIDAKELKDLVKRFGQQISEEEVQQMIDAVDTDHNDKIDYKEFANFLCRPIK